MPLKSGGTRKSRLSPLLTPEQRTRLTDRMAAHVAGVLATVPAIGRRWLLAERDTPALGMTWLPDGGTGLNAELCRPAADAGGFTLVIHADLPFLDADDIVAMLAAAESSGAAIAPDRAGTGTNALALTQPSGFGFAFGPDSHSRHRRALPHAAVIRREALAFDIDTPSDLLAARERPARQTIAE